MIGFLNEVCSGGSGDTSKSIARQQHALCARSSPSIEGSASPPLSLGAGGRFMSTKELLPACSMYVLATQRLASSLAIADTAQREGLKVAFHQLLLDISAQRS